MRKRADHFNRFLFCFGIVPLDQIGGEWLLILKDIEILVNGLIRFLAK